MPSRVIRCAAAVAVLCSLSPAAQAGFIDFDDLTAPSVFVDTVALSEEYAGQGVHFDGESDGDGGKDGGAVVHEDGGFGIGALSGTNFLAFNRSAFLSDFGVPTDPERVTFDSLMGQVSIFAASGHEPNTFALEAFDIDGNLLDSGAVATSQGLDPDWQQLLVSSSSTGIKSVRLRGTGIDNAFIFDNFAFTTFSTGGGPSPVIPEPSSFLLMGLGLVSGRLATKRRQS